MTSIELISNSKVFSLSEFKHPDKMNPDFIKRVIEWRNRIGCPCLITSDFREGSTSHESGLALDIIQFKPGKYREEVLNIEHMFLNALSFGFSGVGLYHNWSYTNKNGERINCAGIHIDDLKRNVNPTAWFRIGNLYLYYNTITGFFEDKSGNKQIDLQTISNTYKHL